MSQVKCPLSCRGLRENPQVHLKAHDYLHPKARIDLRSGDHQDKDKLESSPHLTWNQGPQDTRLGTTLQLLSIRHCERGVTHRLEDQAAPQPPLGVSLGSDMEAL